MEGKNNISCIMANIAWNENDWKSPSDNKTNFRWTQVEGNIPHESWNFDFDNPRNTEEKIFGFIQFTHPPKNAEKDKFLIIFRSSNKIVGFYGNAEIKKEAIKKSEYEYSNIVGDKKLVVLLDNKIDDSDYNFLFGKERVGMIGFNYLNTNNAQKILDEAIKLNPNQMEVLNKLKDWLKQGDTQMEKQYWLIAPGENARKWDEYSKNGEIGIGWDELGNIEKYDSDYESFQNDYIKTYKSENDNYKGSSPKQIWDFYKNISIGDIIFARNGVRQIIGMGKVISDYIYDDSRDEYKQIRKVEWEKIGEWNYPGQSSRDTVHKLRREQAEEILKAMNSQMPQQNTKLDEIKKNLLANKNIILTGAPGTGKTFMAKQIAEKMGCTENEICFVQFHPSYDYTDFVEGLRPTDKDGNGNVGFERKDGVFKAFCERALKNFVDSRKSVDVLQHERTINEIVEDFLNDAVEKKTQFETQTKNPFSVESFTDRKVFVSIPQNEKVKTLPIPIDDILELISNDVQLNIGKDVSEYFNRKWRTQQDSYIYVLTKQIQKNVKENKNNETVTMEKIQAKNFVFIIDEINRGEVAKIFGELFYSVDPGYRVTSDDLNAIKNGNKTITTIKTQYANLETEGNEFDKVLQKKEKDFGHFFIPENVYIIGTMNDIDRSVESMDFAFRRRFSWIEVKAEDTQYMLDAELDAVLAKEAKRRMDNLNAAIWSWDEKEKKSKGIDDLNEAYHIGASYFLKLKNYDGDFESLWNYHIKGILQEYLRGSGNEAKIVELKKVYDREEE